MYSDSFDSIDTIDNTDKTPTPSTISASRVNTTTSTNNNIESTDTIDLKVIPSMTIFHFRFTYLPAFRAKTLEGEVMPISIGAFVTPSY